MKKDRIYAAPRDEPEDFCFDNQVAEVFTDMINRSVPGYPLMLDMIGVIARQKAQPGSLCYDLGCSLGASTLSLRHNVPSESCKIIAVDNAPAMVERCKINIECDNAGIPVEIRCEDILCTPIENASLVVMNLTLQFIAPDKREQLLSRIFQGLNSGGALILSEKIHTHEQQDQSLLTDLHHHFKRLQGYSDLEISQKRSALETVLLAESLQTHTDRLKRVGFSQVTCWFQCFNFISVLACK